ncbi:MAG TPA: hypothetical protein VH593_28245, partial [Ktedonobacteraceae bacterium]
LVDHNERQRLAEMVLENLAREFHDKIDPFEPAVLRGCFEVEVGRFKKLRRHLYEQDAGRYLLEEEEYLLELKKDVYKHLVGYIKYVRSKRRYKVWIAFDNVDRGSDAYQQFVYSFAHQLAADAHCATLITLRQDTFLEAQEAGFLDVRSSDIIFQISAPEFRRVVSKRRKYVDKIVETNEVPRLFKSYLPLVRLLNWHINRLVLDQDDFVRLFITSMSLNNVRYSLAMLRDYYTSYHATFHELYRQHATDSGIPSQLALDYLQEHVRFIQALMLGDTWSYQGEKSGCFNIFSVTRSEKTSHFLMLRILAYLSLERNATSFRISVTYDKLSNDFIFLGYPRAHLNDALRKLLNAGLVVSPSLASTVAEARVEIPDPLPEGLKVALSAKGHYYLNKLAADQYYLLRVGEDTVWYDEELAHRYIQCLQDSMNAQAAYGAEDSLEATEARDVFLTYLKKSLLDESQGTNSRYVAKDWAGQVNALTERGVFGKQLTETVYMPAHEEALDHSPSAAPPIRGLAVLPKRTLVPVSDREYEQRELFDADELGGKRSTEEAYKNAIEEAVRSVGPMPKGVKWQNSVNMVRVLWALEVAFQAGVGSLRASEIARIIHEYGG